MTPMLFSVDKSKSEKSS